MGPDEQIALGFAIILIVGIALAVTWVSAPRCPACRKKMQRGATKCFRCGNDLSPRE